MRKQKNQLQSFQRAFFIDWKLGVLHRAWRFVPALFLAVFCVLKGLLFQRYEVPHDLFGILSLMFFGDDVVTPNSLSLCLEWVGFQIFLLLITNDYTSSSLGSFGECMLMKTGSKSAWWLSKCCWMVCTVTISFAALILTGVTLCPMFHYTVRLSGIYVLVAPFCAVLSVSLIGQFITMLGVNPAVTLILLSGSVTLALFVDSPWYIWAASMQTRYYELHLVWISCLIWLLASLLLIPIGTVIFARKDIYLKGERTNAR